MHSKYAMACSEQLTLENMDSSAREKGIAILGTGDFTHPMWIKEIKDKLLEENGLYKLKSINTPTRFVLSSEVCTIFEDRSKKYRKIHHCILAPSIDAAEQINAQLAKRGALASDGRPALSMSPSELVEAVRQAGNDAFVFPAHAWTPWFGVLGAFSGFDSIKEAYEDQAQHIYALETGLSSDPSMNWRISGLDKYALISGSDAHSLPKMGREAVVMESDSRLSYADMISRIKSKEMKMTVEFYPEEGKYHYDGHRNCNISFTPQQSAKYNDRCPKCGKRLTIGVVHRINQLADREEGFAPKGAVPFVHAIPLQEVIAHVLKKTPTSPYVKALYEKTVSAFGSEFNVLLKSDPEKIKSIDKDLGRAIESVREGRVNLVPGYDGVFGIIDIFNEVKVKKEKGKQAQISEF